LYAHMNNKRKMKKKKKTNKQTMQMSFEISFLHIQSTRALSH
jgi:hypothetical protein